MEPSNTRTNKQREQRVRFSSKKPRSSSPPHRTSAPQTTRTREDCTQSPSRARPSTRPSQTSRSPSSVKSAVDKFHIGDEDADPSILLPSPQISPYSIRKRKRNEIEHTSPETSHRYTREEKGKARATESESINDSDRSGFLRVAGKEQELTAAREEFDKNHPGDTSYDSDSISRKHRDEEREKDKARIRLLEEEINRLKEEVSD